MMLKVIGSLKESISYTVAYSQSARVLNIESNCMDDDCRPYRESTGCMVWLNKDKIPCEIECIFPVVTENPGLWINPDAEAMAATPKVAVSYEEKPIEIAFENSQLMLIFNKIRRADKKYVSANCEFYVSDDELVAIVCTDFKYV